MAKIIIFVAIVAIFYSSIVNGSEWNALPLVNTSGPTVATTVWIDNWNSDGSGAMIFSSVWNGFFFRDNVSAPFFEPDSGIYVIENIVKVLKGDQSANITLVTGILNWTTSFIGFSGGGLKGLELPFRGFLASSGRFPTAPRFVLKSVPGKIAIVDATNSSAAIVHVISPANVVGDNCEYYYQKIKLYDINNDGLLDIVSIRARDWSCNPLPLFPTPLTAEFIALIQPSNRSKLLQPWELVVLYNFKETGIVGLGAGGQFDFYDIDAFKNKCGDSQPELIVANFFFPELAIYTLGKPGQTWFTPGRQVNRVIVDNTLGPMYDVKVVDINNDGDLDLVATTHTVRQDNGIYAYEIEAAFNELSFPNASVVTVNAPRYPLATNFSVFGRPATSQRYRTGTFALIPNRNKKPIIALTTDGGGSLVVLTPEDEKKKNWNYISTTLYQFGADVLDPIVYDFDGDGKYEISASVIAGDAIITFEQAN